MKYIALILAVLLVISSATLGYNVSHNKQEIDIFGANDIIRNLENLEINLTSIVYVKNSKGEWEEYQRLHGEENRIWVSLDKVPQTLIDAIVSIEDQRYFSHVGVDWKRTLSAFLNQFMGFYDSNQGGSTITQQLIKNITGDKKQNASRKAREIIRALVIEKKLDKNKILEAYLNTISLGNGICGVQVAANYYFNKDVSELSLVECAAIAGITKNPSAYNPEDKPDGNKKRRETVLAKMLECEKITEKEYLSAIAQDIKLDDSRRDELEAPINDYFIDTLISNVTENLVEKYNCSVQTASSMLYNGGYKIYSTVDMRIQGIMEDVYENENKYFSQKSRLSGKRVQSSMTITDYQGHIVGVVGGVGKKTVNRGLNRAVDSPRQPGSTMKPLGAYAPAIDSGLITYSSFYQDTPLDKYYPDGKKGPKEWYGYYAGKMSIAKAIERSANTIPCKIVKELGVDASYNFLTQKLQLKHLTEVDKNLASLALGGCQYGITTTESAAAYAIFGNGGKFFAPVTYYYIEDSNGLIILEDDDKGNQVINPATSDIMNELLQNVVYGSSGTGRGISSYSKMKAYAKTGTSSESNDLWMVAGTPYYVGSVWYGFDKPQQIWNAGAAATVWKAIMKEVHKDLEIKEFAESGEILEAKYCGYSGLLAAGKCYWKKDGKYVPGVDVAVCDGKHKKEDTDSSSKTSSSSDNSSSSVSSTESQTSSNVSSNVSSSVDSSATSSDAPVDSSSDGESNSSESTSSGESSDSGNSSEETSSENTILN